MMQVLMPCHTGVTNVSSYAFQREHIVTTTSQHEHIVTTTQQAFLVASNDRVVAAVPAAPLLAVLSGGLDSGLLSADISQCIAYILTRNAKVSPQHSPMALR